MKKYFYQPLSEKKKNSLLKRPAINLKKAFKIVKPILNDVKGKGLPAALKYANQFDKFKGKELRVSAKEFAAAEKNLSDEIKRAIETAAENIRKFHLKQQPNAYELDTMPGIKCSREFRAIENVGLYIPGGTAVLPSTMLMLGIPASIGGCGRIVVCSPSKDGEINAPLLYAAGLCGVREFYKIGGAQAIALMAYGDKNIPKVDKIFGPGNQYVTAAKMLVSIDADGCVIDMPAGPSEVLIIGDENADASFVAADLLSQAEHGIDSQVVLITTSENLADTVIEEVYRQAELLPRKKFALKAIDNSFILVTENLDEAFSFSNMYAPEHLILHLKDAEKYKQNITNAGSVFLGYYSPESVGDYASGTNHSLPTYGFARSLSGVTVESFLKSITFQQLTKEGLKNISLTVETLAEVEGLDAHKNAVKIRISELPD
jgi:histidinol dehydrogenase